MPYKKHRNQQGNKAQSLSKSLSSWCGLLIRHFFISKDNSSIVKES